MKAIKVSHKTFPKLEAEEYTLSTMETIRQYHRCASR